MSAYLLFNSLPAYPDQNCSHKECEGEASRILPGTNSPVCWFHLEQAEKVRDAFLKTAEFGGSNSAVGKHVSFPKVK